MYIKCYIIPDHFHPFPTVKKRNEKTTKPMETEKKELKKADITVTFFF